MYLDSGTFWPATAPFRTESAADIPGKDQGRTVAILLGMDWRVSQSLLQILVDAAGGA
jgi:hypothetical protein